MTYDALELSLTDGQPIYLYEFTHGLTTWRYCAADRNIVVGAFEWLSIRGGVKHEEISQTGDSKTDLLTITAPSTIPVVGLFRGLPPSTEVAVVIRAKHFGDPEVRVQWVGSIVDINRRGVDRVEIKCQDLLASLEMAGLALGWERNCPYSVYDHNCGVNRDLFRTDTVLTASAGGVIESADFAAHPDPWFAGGYAEWESAPGVIERRFIKQHTGVQLRMLGGSEGLPVGAAVTTFAGCAGDGQTCLDKFDNLDNHGGFPMLPGKSPFDGELVF